MKLRMARSSWLARGLMLLGAILLFVAPTLPAAAAMPKGDCCADMPCHDQGRKALCPEACVVACQVIVAPEAQFVGPVEIGSAPIAPMVALLPLGRALAPELPPPR